MAFLLWRENYFLPIGKIYVFLQSISQGNHEALYLRLAVENLRNFQLLRKQEYNGFARIAWAVCYFS